MLWVDALPFSSGLCFRARLQSPNHVDDFRALPCLGSGLESPRLVFCGGQDSCKGCLPEAAPQNGGFAKRLREAASRSGFARVKSRSLRGRLRFPAHNVSQFPPNLKCVIRDKSLSSGHHSKRIKVLFACPVDGKIVFTDGFVSHTGKCETSDYTTLHNSRRFPETWTCYKTKVDDLA